MKLAAQAVCVCRAQVRFQRLDVKPEGFCVGNLGLPDIFVLPSSGSSSVEILGLSWFLKQDFSDCSSALTSSGAVPLASWLWLPWQVLLELLSPSELRFPGGRATGEGGEQG